MSDLEEAKNRLVENDLTLCIVKKGQIIFETGSHGISGFLDAIEKLGQKLEGASVADRVAGKAIALLCIYSKVKALYAFTLSTKAKELLEGSAIQFEWNDLVENILNPDGSKICPFEQMAMGISDPREAYQRLKALQESCSKTRKPRADREPFISDEDAKLKRSLKS